MRKRARGRTLSALKRFILHCSGKHTKRKYLECFFSRFSVVCVHVSPTKLLHSSKWNMNMNAWSLLMLIKLNAFYRTHSLSLLSVCLPKIIMQQFSCRSMCFVCIWQCCVFKIFLFPSRSLLSSPATSKVYYLWHTHKFYSFRSSLSSMFYNWVITLHVRASESGKFQIHDGEPEIGANER